MSLPLWGVAHSQSNNLLLWVGGPTGNKLRQSVLLTIVGDYGRLWVERIMIMSDLQTAIDEAVTAAVEEAVDSYDFDPIIEDKISDYLTDNPDVLKKIIESLNK